MPELFRSLIFVPGNNRRFLDKARNLRADIVCLDLEDSVPGPQKAEARRMVAGALDRGGFEPAVFVRVNSPASGMVPDDLGAVVRDGLEGVVVPKVEGPADLDPILDTVGRLEPAGAGIGVMPSIESAPGVVNSYAICSRDRRVCGVVFGIFDLLNDMGVEYDKGDPLIALYGRSKVPVDAAAAGVPAIDGIWQDIGDADGLAADCRLGKSLGYAGKSLIHPGQIEATHQLFAPAPSEVAWARRVCEVYPETARTGRGAVAVDGKMIDEVHYKRARAVLDLAGSSS